MENNKQFLKLFLLCFFTLIYNLFFWEENLGLNLFLFNSLILLAVGYLYRSNLSQNKLALLLICGTMLTSIAMLYHNTLNSKIAWLISFSATVAVLQKPDLQLLINTWLFFFLNLFSSFVRLPAEIKSILKLLTKHSNKMKIVNRKAGLLFIPLIIFSVFYVIFNIANPVFASYNSQVFEIINQFLVSIFANISISRLFFILFGLWLISALIYRWNIDDAFELTNIKGTFFITRTRIVDKNIRFKSLDLKNEAQIAFLVVASVNLLLLVVNAIDIRFLWFGFQPTAGTNLAQLVHEGTYMLIFSILLSMAILLYYFRNNLNFYKKNELLKKLAIVWLVQNGILVISVLFRCYYYISEFGLAYKRIGVILFLMLTLIGLISFYNKISNNKSAYYLLHINTIAAYVLLVAMSAINWDKLIVNFNFQHPNISKGIDISFIVSRSDATLPIVFANIAKLPAGKGVDDGWKKWASSEIYLKSRKEEFLKDYEQVSWLSWNFSDAETYQLLKK